MVPHCLHLDLENTSRDVFLAVVSTDDFATHSVCGFVYCILPVLNQVSFHSPLYKAVLAVSTNLAILWSATRRWSALPWKYYAEAVNSLRLAVADDNRNRDDDVLMATLLLDFCDLINAHFHTVQQPYLRRHQLGALALVRHRASANLRNAASRTMLLSLRSGLIHRALHEGQDVSQYYGTLFDSFLMPENMFTKFDNLTSRLTSLLARSQVTPLSAHDMSQLCREFLDLDSQFDNWQEDVPEERRPRVLEAHKMPTSIRRAGVYRDRCSVYSDVETGSVWNLWRCRRLLLLLALQSLTESLDPSVESDVLIPHIETTLQTLVDGVCESVPFFIGDFNESTIPFQLNITFPSVTDRNLEFPTSRVSHARLATGAGGLLIMEPLILLRNMIKGLAAYRPLKVRDGQEEWIRVQLRRLQ